MKREDAEEKPEHCIECGRLGDLQGVAVTLGRQTFHLFYVCSQCSNNVDLRGLLKIITRHLDGDKARHKEKSD